MVIGLDFDALQKHFRLPTPSFRLPTPSFSKIPKFVLLTYPYGKQKGNQGH